MKPILRALRRALRGLFGAPEGADTRRRVARSRFRPRADRPAREVDGVHCPTCQNHFWIEHSAIEPPNFCPYCGIRFEGTVALTNDEFDAQIEGTD